MAQIWVSWKIMLMKKNENVYARITSKYHERCYLMVSNSPYKDHSYNNIRACKYSPTPLPPSYHIKQIYHAKHYKPL